LVWTAEAGRDSARILYDGSSEIGRRAEQQLRETVTDFGEELRWRRARDWGWTHADLQVFDLEREEVSGGSEFVGWILSMILPVVLMVMLPQGAYYSTLDTIVGERERGTWETLLTSSLDSSEIVRGKFGYVVLWSLVSTLLNLVGMLLFLWAGAEILGLGDRLTVRLEWAPMLVALAGVILFAVAIAAVMILVALPARSYREGQAALSPVYLVSAFGAMLAVTGSETLTYVQAAIPVVNVAALLRGSLRGELPAGPTLVALLSLAVVAWVAVRWAARVLGDEDTYFSEGLSLRSLLRKRSEPR
jgi:sodium transport system permease protein